MMAQMGVADLRRLQAGCLEATVGTRLTPDEALVAGERIATLQRLVTVYLGYRPEDDFDLSDRLLEKIPSAPGAGAGMTPDEFRCARDSFYEHHGWSLETGAPTEETLSRTGLADFHIGKPQRPNTHHRRQSCRMTPFHRLLMNSPRSIDQSGMRTTASTS
jgi:aldehyde:ferredoxin oxidoreductase